MGKGERACGIAEVTAGQREASDQCGCMQCLIDRKAGKWVGGKFIPEVWTRMIVCGKCGNKRCPHGTDHRNPCSGSNLPGQKGSRYG